MIRFKPDTWQEALMRPFAMAAPDANVYVEVSAPDLRFAVALIAALAMLLLWRRLPERRPAVLALLALTALAFIPWMQTSGNGRYFVPILLVAGPLVGGLIHGLPFTKAFRLFLMATAVAAQATAVTLNPPWGSWAWLDWDQAPYFHVAKRAAPVQQGVTYIGLSSISYSLIAPQFPADSRWISLASGGATPRDSEWVRQFIAKGERRVLVVPSVSAQTAWGQPTAEVREALNALLGPHALALQTSQPCETRPSRALAAIARAAVTEPEPAGFAFWLCPLDYPVHHRPKHEDPQSLQVESVFNKLEALCPRFFRAGESATRRIDGGAMRHYPGSDMKVYVLDDGKVFYKFWRALNPVLVGLTGEVLSDAATVQCDKIRGRAGLPWDREI